MILEIIFLGTSLWMIRLMYKQQATKRGLKPKILKDLVTEPIDPITFIPAQDVYRGREGENNSGYPPLYNVDLKGKFAPWDIQGISTYMALRLEPDFDKKRFNLNIDEYPDGAYVDSIGLGANKRFEKRNTDY
jgi:hypothetical protein